MINYGELYYDHYTSFLGEAIDREVFLTDETEPKIQILKYANVFDDCFVYNTLGVSSYAEQMGANVEVSMVVDDAFASVGTILANVLFYGITSGISLNRGAAISGVENIDASFVGEYDKSAVYFTEYFGFPDEYNDVQANVVGAKNGKILLAFFISQSEYEYLKNYGTEKFEDLLEDSGVDPFEIRRASVI